MKLDATTIPRERAFRLWVLLWIFATLPVLGGAQAAASHAAGGEADRFQVMDVRAACGTTQVSVPVSLCTELPVHRLAFQLCYGQIPVSVQDVVPAGRTSMPGPIDWWQETSECVGVVLFSFGQAAIPPGCGAVMELLLDLCPWTPPGEYPLTVEQLEVMSEFSPVPVTVEHGVLTIPATLDVDGNGEKGIDTDLVFVYRCMAGIPEAVPPWYRETEDFPPDEEVREAVDANLAAYDVDGDGVTSIDTDLVFMYRCMLGMEEAVPAWYRELGDFPPDAAICSGTEALCPEDLKRASGSRVLHAGTHLGGNEIREKLENTPPINVLEVGCVSPDRDTGEATVPFLLTTDQDLTRLTLTVAYDAERLEAPEVHGVGRTETGPASGGIEAKEGEITVSCFDFAGAPVIPRGEGRILEAVFRIRDGVMPEEIDSTALAVTRLQARRGPREVGVAVKTCRPEDPVWAVSEAEASGCGAPTARSSHVVNFLAGFLLPAAVSLALRAARRAFSGPRGCFSLTSIRPDSQENGFKREPCDPKKSL